MRTLLLIVILGVLPLWSAPAWSCTIRVNYYTYGALYALDSKGQGSGVDKDLVEQLAQRAGCTVQGGWDSRVRIWAGLQEGALDAATSALCTPEREALGDILPYLITRNLLLVQQYDAGRLTSLERILYDPSARVVVVRSYLHGAPFDPWLAMLRARGRVYEVGDFETAARVFAAGRASAMISEDLALNTVHQAFGRSDGFHVVAGVSSTPLIAGLVLSRQTLSATDRQRLKATLNDMLLDGSVDRILKRHLGDALAQQVRYDP